MSEGERLSWTEVRDRIHGMILDSTYMPGDKLPRDEDLARSFGCARSTVHRAMGALSESGIVERRRKGGTTVRADPVTRATLDIPVTRREIEAKGMVHSYRLIQKSMQMIPDAVAEGLGLPAPRAMLRVEALHLADSAPYIFEDRWVCAQTVPEILHVDLERESANEWLVHNRPYSRCDVRLYAHKADHKDAARLSVEIGDALLIIERATWIGANPITSVRATTMPGYQLLTGS